MVKVKSASVSYVAVSCYRNSWFLPIVSEDVHKEKNDVLNNGEYYLMTQGQPVTWTMSSSSPFNSNK